MEPTSPNPTGIYFVTSIVLYNVAAACGFMYFVSFSLGGSLFGGSQYSDPGFGWLVFGGLFALGGLITLCIGVYYLVESIYYIAARK